MGFRLYCLVLGFRGTERHLRMEHADASPLQTHVCPSPPPPKKKIYIYIHTYINKHIYIYIYIYNQNKMNIIIKINKTGLKASNFDFGA